MMTIDFARNVLGLERANSTEMDPQTPHPVIDLMHDQRDVTDKGVPAALVMSATRSVLRASASGTARWLCTARLPSVLITRALLNTASPAVCLKLGSWISAERLS